MSLKDYPEVQCRGTEISQAKDEVAGTEFSQAGDEVPGSIALQSDQYDPLNFHEKFQEQKDKKEQALQKEVDKEKESGKRKAEDESGSDVFKSFRPEDNNRQGEAFKAIEVDGDAGSKSAKKPDEQQRLAQDLTGQVPDNEHDANNKTFDFGFKDPEDDDLGMDFVGKDLGEEF